MDTLFLSQNGSTIEKPRRIPVASRGVSPLQGSLYKGCPSGKGPADEDGGATRSTAEAGHLQAQHVYRSVNQVDTVPKTDRDHVNVITGLDDALLLQHRPNATAAVILGKNRRRGIDDV